MHQACGTSQMAPEEVGCVQVMFSHSEHPDSCPLEGELRDLLRPSVPTLFSLGSPRVTATRDRCGARETHFLWSS